MVVLMKQVVQNCILQTPVACSSCGAIRHMHPPRRRSGGRGEYEATRSY